MKRLIVILLFLLLVSTLMLITSCSGGKFEDLSLDVQEISVSSESIDEVGRLFTVQGEYTAHSDYVGPYPPNNAGQHHYRIEVFALKESPDNLVLKLNAKQSYSDIVKYFNKSRNGENNILARGYIVGTYEN